MYDLKDVQISKPSHDIWSAFNVELQGVKGSELKPSVDSSIPL